MLEFIFNGFMNTTNKKGYLNMLINTFFGSIRKLILSFSDPLIYYQLWNYKIQIPFSHNLPAVLVSHKNYNTNLPRISTYINTKYQNPPIVDIGANVGDTAVLLRSFVEYPILCVEGEKKFYDLLIKNTSQIKDVTYSNNYLGETDEKIKGVYKAVGGTGNIFNEENSSLQTKKLDTVVNDYPEFINAKLLKIDTDGFDFKIMKGAVELLKSSKPVIFTEFDQNLMKQINEDFNDMFNFFRNLNYCYIIFYDNFGDYLISLNIDEQEKIEDITNYFDNRNTEKFCDICVFHAQDKDLFELTRKKELEFFSKNR